jgi:hypothetical protein
MNLVCVLGVCFVAVAVAAMMLRWAGWDAEVTCLLVWVAGWLVGWLVGGGFFHSYFVGLVGWLVPSCWVSSLG